MQTKGLSQKKRNVIIHIWERKRKHAIARKIARKKKRKRDQTVKVYQRRNMDKASDARSSRNTEIINLPERFDLHHNYNKVMPAIDKFVKAMNQPKAIRKHISVNFNAINHIGISAALLLAANLDVWKIKAGKLKSHHDRWKPSTRTLLNQMGLFELLDMPPLTARHKKTNMSFVKFLSAQQGDGKKAKQLRKRIEKTMKKSLPFEHRDRLFTSLSEALINACHHAYPNPKNLEVHEKWWMTAAYDRSTTPGKLTVAICDRGFTIPKTMYKKQEFLEKIRETPLFEDDAHFIKLAMHDSVTKQKKAKQPPTRSRTGERHRGNGLKQLLGLVGLEKTGEVHIISGVGHCCFTFKNGKLEVKSSHNTRYRMHGTLVEWRISV